ncbi:MAG: prolyl aminopeptidase [Myxococcota bacterium]|nr:prolyl aminopeptidase [Myxococcota bacterium]MEE2779564.1 prolyl aminopeptidase [Myxococcota bacterium]
MEIFKQLEQILYPPTRPLESGMLSVGDGHTLYWERSGNPRGRPVVVLHGGPGGGSQPLYRRYFDPKRYDIVLFDQRGCGRSLPHASLEHNTTQSLVADIERLRVHLGVESWQVFGGSWGSTLALAYAQAHPERVLELVLRGIFLGAEDELQWLYQRGASRLFPDRFQCFRDYIPAEEQGDLLHAYHRRLTQADPQVSLPAARRWTAWELNISRLVPDEREEASLADDPFVLAFARIEAHYFVNGVFLRPGQLLEGMEGIAHIPGVIVHGRYDVICPVENAWNLHAVWPASHLEIVADAGHSVVEPGTAKALVGATDHFAKGSGER